MHDVILYKIAFQHRWPSQCLPRMYVFCVPQVQELVALGSLLDYLTDQPHGVSLENDLKLWAGQVASGRSPAVSQSMATSYTIIEHLKI